MIRKLIIWINNRITKPFIVTEVFIATACLGLFSGHSRPITAQLLLTAAVVWLSWLWAVAAAAA